MARPADFTDREGKQATFFVSLFDQCYWVLGSVLGALMGELIKFDTTGIDFAMTALFVVICVDQWKADVYKRQVHHPGRGLQILCLQGVHGFREDLFLGLRYPRQYLYFLPFSPGRVRSSTFLYTVSYTHLAVYKRQALHWLQPAGSNGGLHQHQPVSRPQKLRI